MMKSKGFYRVSMAVLVAVTAALLGMTLLHVTRGEIFDQPLTAVLLALVALFTAICLCIELPRGNLLYRCGFYLLHGGMVLLLCGFLLSRALSLSFSLAFPVGGSLYGAVENEDGSMTDLGFSLGVSKVQTDYYLDENGRETENPKHYEARVTILTGGGVREESLTVNHPLRVKGARSYKIYLMRLGEGENGGESAYFLLKSDPAEGVILTGILLVLAGSVLQCLLAPLFSGRSRKTKEDAVLRREEGEP